MRRATRLKGNIETWVAGTYAKNAAKDSKIQNLTYLSKLQQKLLHIKEAQLTEIPQIFTKSKIERKR